MDQKQINKLGPLLQATREQKKWSREYLARQINIPIRVLTQIESSQHQHLPPLVYTRGFVLSLAQQLGLSRTRVLRLLEQELGEDTAPPMEADDLPVVRHESFFARLNLIPLYVWLRRVRTLLVLGVLGGVTWLGVQVFQHPGGVADFIEEAKTTKRLPAAQKFLKSVTGGAAADASGTGEFDAGDSTVGRSAVGGSTAGDLAGNLTGDLVGGSRVGGVKSSKQLALDEKKQWTRRILMRRALTRETTVYLLNNKLDEWSFLYLTRRINRVGQPPWREAVSLTW